MTKDSDAGSQVSVAASSIPSTTKKSKVKPMAEEKSLDYNNLVDLLKNSSSLKSPKSLKILVVYCSCFVQGFVDTWRVFPKTVFAIFGNEFCERFSYYGMRTILTLYVVNVLQFSESNSIALFHGFIVLCYSSGIPGSIIADGYVGKFHTILWVSLFYCSGNVVLAIAATFDKGHAVHPGLDLLGLIIIGLGTGGIKPCVSPFGGDQFKAGQEALLEMFFSVFYFSINAGALISTFITPMIRATQCLDQESCYPAAFGLPAALMIVSVVAFAVGAPWYKKFPPTENVIMEVSKAIWKALSNKRKNPHIARDHWFEHFLDEHDQGDLTKMSPNERKELAKKEQFVTDIKAFLRQVVMCVPMPVFWALYDQQGSVWVIQAVEMNGEIWPGAQLLPDQMTVLNAVLILVFIPIFQGGIYPLIRRFGVEPTPLRRMTAGGFMIAGAFIISMFVQFAVNSTLPPIPASTETHVSFLNTFNCNVTVNQTFGQPSIKPIVLGPGSSYRQEGINGAKGATLNLTWAVTPGPNCSAAVVNQLKNPIVTSAKTGSAYFTTLTLNDYGFNTTHLRKSQAGEGQFIMGLQYDMARDFPNYPGSFFWCRSDNVSAYAQTCFIRDGSYFQAVAVNRTHNSDWAELKPGTWKLWYANNTLINPDKQGRSFWDYDYKLPNGTRRPKQVKSPRIIDTGVNFTITVQGGIYLMDITNGQGPVPKATILTVARENTVSILWQIPQYVVVTAAEILFSVTGLEFSYSQAPLSMKSVVGAVWLLTNAVGDLLVLAIELSNAFTNLAYEQLCFAIIMIVVMVIFMLLSIFWYEYGHFLQHEENGDESDDDVNEDDDDDDDEEEKSTTSNDSIAKKKHDEQA